MKLKRIIAGAIATVVIMAGFTGCSGEKNTDNTETTTAVTKVQDSSADSKEENADTEKEENSDSEATRTIVDHTGAEVTIPAELDRIVISSIMPLPSVYCLFRGSAEDIVGIHPSSMAAAENSYLINVFPELANADTSFVENGEINIEQLLELKPDVVFYNASNKEEREMYDNAGIPAIAFSTSMAKFDSVETYADWIELFGEIYGENEMANEIIEEGRQVAKEITDITDKISEEERPDVLILYKYDNGVIQTSGSGHFGQYWITSAGGNNVAGEIDGSPEINMEQIYEWNPDIILITNFSSYLPEDLYNNSIEGHDWSNVSAVKNGQVYKFPLGMYRWYPPASDTPLVLKWLAKTIQPELFADMDIDAEIKEFYQKHYDVTLTDEDIQEIYNPAREASGT